MTAVATSIVIPAEALIDLIEYLAVEYDRGLGVLLDDVAAAQRAVDAYCGPTNAGWDHAIDARDQAVRAVVERLDHPTRGVVVDWRMTAEQARALVAQLASPSDRPVWLVAP